MLPVELEFRYYVVALDIFVKQYNYSWSEENCTVQDSVNHLHPWSQMVVKHCAVALLQQKHKAGVNW